MGKTTIDGLAVRTSSSTRRASGATSSRRQVGGSLADIETPRRKRVISDMTMRPQSGQRSRSSSATFSGEDEFLAPVSGFGFNEPDTSLGADDGADWSDLLDQFGDSKKSSSRKREADLGLDGDFFFDEDEEEAPRKVKKPRKKKKKGKVRRTVFAVIFLAIVAVGIGLYVWGDSLIARLTGGNSGLWDTLWAMVADEVPFDADSNGRTNVLIFGTEGFDMSGTSGQGVHDGAQLTDSIMVVSFDQETKDVALLSLPRDLKVSMACSAGKINEVFWCHNQDGLNEEVGAYALSSQISQILGIEIQYWAHVNWGSVVEIVDTLGGITVTLDEDINDYYNTGMVVRAGVPTQLTGIQAVALARARYGTNGGDFTRGNSQQKIVEAIAQKVVENGVGVTEALGLLNILGDNFRSNFSADNIKSGMSLVSGFDPSTIRNVPLVDYDNDIYYVKTATINEVSYVIPSAGQNDYRQIQAYVKAMFSSNPAMREGSQIAVYNATGEPGVASAEQSRLEGDGYVVFDIYDAAVGDCDARFCLYANGEKPATQAALEARYQVQAQSFEYLPADIWPGAADIIVVIGQTGE